MGFVKVVNSSATNAVEILITVYHANLGSISPMGMAIACHALNIVLTAQILTRTIQLFVWVVPTELIWLLMEPASNALWLTVSAADHPIVVSAMQGFS